MDLGEGPGRARPSPPFFSTKLRPEGSKKVWETPPPPPSQGVDGGKKVGGPPPPPPPHRRVWMTGPPPYLKVSRSGTSTEINILSINIQPELDMTMRENHTLIERVAYGI